MGGVGGVLGPSRSGWPPSGCPSPAPRRRRGRAADPGWRGPAALDAATRMVESLVRAGGIPRGSAAHGCSGGGRPSGGDGGRRDRARRAEHVLVGASGSGRARGPPALPRRRARPGPRPARGGRDRGARGRARPGAGPARPGAARRPREPPRRPWRSSGLSCARTAPRAGDPPALLRPRRRRRLLEALLFRGLFDLGASWASASSAWLPRWSWSSSAPPCSCSSCPPARPAPARPPPRGAAAAGVPRKIPRLGDRYFQSRLMSDMAERAHSVHQLAPAAEPRRPSCPRAAFELVAHRRGHRLARSRGARRSRLWPPRSRIAMPLAAQPALAERDLRAAQPRGRARPLLPRRAARPRARPRPRRRARRCGASTRRCSSSGRAPASASLRTPLVVEASQALVGFGLAAWLLVDALRRARRRRRGTALLLVYWALSLPALGQEVALARCGSIPPSATSRCALLEPLGAPEEPDRAAADAARRPAAPAAGAAPPAIALEAVTVDASGGHRSSTDVDLEHRGGRARRHRRPVGRGQVEPGRACSSAGTAPRRAASSSTASRSTGAGSNALRARDRVGRSRRSALEPLAARQPPLRRRRRRPLSLGAGRSTAADLRDVLERLPDGLQTPLGEGGGLVSGGEGQRVRLGRALLAARRAAGDPRRAVPRPRPRRSAATLLGARARRCGATRRCCASPTTSARRAPSTACWSSTAAASSRTARRPRSRARPGSRYRALLDAEDGGARRPLVARALAPAAARGRAASRRTRPDGGR